MINKFLHPNGGSETYIFNLGKYLQAQGHEVQYFGMEHTGRCVGNHAEAYTSDMDFHGGSKLSKLLYPVKTIYSHEARRQIRKVLDDFAPDVCHLNNFNYQLTPSIILEIRKWEKETGKKCRILYTAHDYQLLCPNHMCNNPQTHVNCEKCLNGEFYHCFQGKCIHGSRAKSLIGMMEGYFWKWKKVYREIDTIICCSEFMKMKMDINPIFRQKTIAIHNFIEVDYDQNDRSEGSDSILVPDEETPTPYVLYFGRYSEEKGIRTLIEACKMLPEISFVFAGKGPLEAEVNSVSNIQNVGFQTGKDLKNLIKGAALAIYPSEWYENCPFAVMEAQVYGTPVLGANIGGISELIKDGETGELFESGNVDKLTNRLRHLMNFPDTLTKYREGCKKIEYETIDQYYRKYISAVEKSK